MISQRINCWSTNAFLIKLNPNGDTIWVRKIGLPLRNERCYGIKQTPDGGFIMCGLIHNVDSTGAITDDDVYLVKTDSLGFQQWERTFGGSLDDWAYSVELTSDGGYLVFGTTYSYGIGQYNMYLIKTDNTGNMLWQKTYGGNLQDYGNAIVVTNDGGYLLAGGTYVSTDTVASYLVKTDTAGVVQWQKIYKGMIKREEINAVKQLNNGDLVVSGDEQADSLSTKYFGMAKKLDSNGNVIWQKDYSYFNADSTQHYFFAMDTCRDGGLVMAGMTIDFRAGMTMPQNAFYIVKTDCMGNDSIWDDLSCPLNVGIEVVPKVESDIQIFPNPATDVITLTTNQQLKNINIYNVLFEEVLFKQLKTSNQQLSIDISMWNAGVYFVEVETKMGVMRKKLVKE